MKKNSFEAHAFLLFRNLVTFCAGACLPWRDHFHQDKWFTVEWRTHNSDWLIGLQWPFLLRWQKTRENVTKLNGATGAFQCGFGALEFFALLNSLMCIYLRNEEFIPERPNISLSTNWSTGSLLISCMMRLMFFHRRSNSCCFFIILVSHKCQRIIGLLNQCYEATVQNLFSQDVFLFEYCTLSSRELNRHKHLLLIVFCLICHLHNLSIYVLLLKVKHFWRHSLSISNSSIVKETFLAQHIWTACMEF